MIMFYIPSRIVILFVAFLMIFKTKRNCIKLFPLVHIVRETLKSSSILSLPKNNLILTFIFSFFFKTTNRFFVDNQPEDLKIIREFYRNENSKEAQIYYDNELENALDCNCKLIVIEPKQFGDSLAR